MANEILTMEDLYGFVDEMTKAAEPDLQSLYNKYNINISSLLTLIDKTIAELNTYNNFNGRFTKIQNYLKGAANPGGTYTPETYRNKNNRPASLDELTSMVSENETAMQVYQKFQTIYYSFRTIMTGETIMLFEGINGVVKIVDQNIWLQNSTPGLIKSKKTKQYGFMFTESQASQLGHAPGKMLHDAAFEMSVARDLIRAVTIINYKTEATRIAKDSNIFVKNDRDLGVYIQVRENEQFSYLYFYNFAYNIGDVFEWFYSYIESLPKESVAEKLQDILSSQVPLSIVINGATGEKIKMMNRREWKTNSKGERVHVPMGMSKNPKNNVAGTKEGDFRGNTNQWFQAKRGNPVVGKFGLVEQGLFEIQHYLQLMQSEIGTGSITLEAVDKFTKAFYKEFSSGGSKQIIEEGLKEQIRNAVKALGGFQPNF